ncbi:MAG TPA: DUF4386 family protein [Bacteroidales bacterium]|jgi:hypothetical protein|nr:DUF4386 family protein [Bacteroidales bacterium]HPM86341.1 DUF4386 family protein [Bacteroidales bacterium]
MENSDKQWRNIYEAGAVTTIIVLCGITLDMVVGSITGGDVAALPQTAVERFNQFKNNPLLGLYNLDLLNTIIQIIFIPSFFALYAVHRETSKPSASLALILFLIGTTIFVSGNTALTMLDLSHNYFKSGTEEQKLLIAAAGEAMLAKGSHGNLGVFIGFVLPTFANALMSCVMLNGKVFSRATSYIGIIGNSLMIVYLILVTFNPEVEQLALAFAMPAGLLVMVWMFLYTIKLFKMSK